MRPLSLMTLLLLISTAAWAQLPILAMTARDYGK